MENEWKSDKITPPKITQLGLLTFGRFLRWFYQWARDWYSWGKMVREDIKRLERAVNIPEGDPGDPPGGPPNGDV